MDCPSKKEDYLCELPPEVLHNIIQDVDPKDLAALSQCCKKLAGFITDNQSLFRDVYLAKLVSWFSGSWGMMGWGCEWRLIRRRMNHPTNRTVSNTTGLPKSRNMSKCSIFCQTILESRKKRSFPFPEDNS
jgi:hypothetical protein